MANGFSTVCIIGLGLIGGSLARQIRTRLPETKILAIDNALVIGQAKAGNVIDEALKDIHDARLYESDLIIIGTHLNTAKEILKQLAQLASPTPLRIVDLSSTKASICNLADSLPQTFDFMGGHPLAGREVGGFENSHADLFINKRFLLSPCQKTSAAFESAIKTWLGSLGSIPVVIDAQTHDELMAQVSHFPQLYAIALANQLQQNNPELTLQFLGGGIDDQMRLMASPYPMWRDVFEDNKNNLDAVLSRFIDLLNDVRKDLNSGRLETWFNQSHNIYKQYKAIKENRK